MCSISILVSMGISLNHVPEQNEGTNKFRELKGNEMKLNHELIVSLLLRHCCRISLEYHPILASLF
jgi:hypothetical protein